MDHSHYAVVAALPTEQRQEVLRIAVRDGLSTREVGLKAKQVKAFYLRNAGYVGDKIWITRSATMSLVLAL